MDRSFGRLLLAATLIGGLLALSGPAVAAHCDPGEFHLSGTVTDEATGLPLTQITSVGISLSDGTPYDGLGTNLPASTYETCLPAGSYVVSFFADDYYIEWYDDSPTQAAADVIVVTGDVSGIDAALAHRPLITGRVTDSRTGAPLFTSVGITDAATGVGLDGEGTDSNGVYRFFVEPGTYLISFAADFHWAEWYDDAKRMSKATVITVAADSGVISGIDAELRPCGRPVPDFCIPRNFDR